MTSTELEVVEGTLATEPLSEGKANVLDKRIRQACIRVADNTATLLDLLEEAAVGQAHVALGFPSWTAYVKDAVTISPTDADERKVLVSLMSGKGMSVRAIADVVGAGKSTVSRDLEGVPRGTTKGLDDNNYPPRPEKQEPLDVEYEEEPEPEPEVEPEVKPQPVSKDFKDEMALLFNSVSSFKEILADERFPKARKTIAKNHLNKLQEYIADLQKVVDELMEP